MPDGSVWLIICEFSCGCWWCVLCNVMALFLCNGAMCVLEKSSQWKIDICCTGLCKTSLWPTLVTGDGLESLVCLSLTQGSAENHLYWTLDCSSCCQLWVTQAYLCRANPDKICCICDLLVLVNFSHCGSLYKVLYEFTWRDEVSWCSVQFWNRHWLLLMWIVLVSCRLQATTKEASSLAHCMDMECTRTYEQNVESLLTHGLGDRARIIRVFRRSCPTPWSPDQVVKVFWCMDSQMMMITQEALSFVS